MNLAGKVAVITGGSRGIGAATAIELARHGADISFCDLSSRDEAEPVLRQIETLGRRALFFQSGARTRACRVETHLDALPSGDRNNRPGIDTSVDAARRGRAPRQNSTFK